MSTNTNTVAHIAKASDKNIAQVIGKEEVQIVSGTSRQIIIPEGMKTIEAIEFLRRKQTDDETIIRLVEPINAHPLEGAYAFSKALNEIYGWTYMSNTGFWNQNPPMLRSMEIGYGNTVQVPIGKFNLPAIEGALYSSVTVKDGSFIFQLTGEVKKKHKDEICKLAEHTRQILKRESIYRGAAIKITKFQPPTGDFNWDDNLPGFIDISQIDEKGIILNENTHQDLDTNVWTPIRKTQILRKNRIPIRRGILLKGDYGVGKTLAATITGKIATENGWTYIQLMEPRQLAQAINFAKNYQPAVIFVEDIDQVLSVKDETDRDQEINTILNTIDGADSKNMEVMLVFTTNDADRLTAAFRRFKRLDALINFDAPTKDTAIKFIRYYGDKLLEKDIDLNTVGEMLAGRNPAMISEVVTRAKLYAISKNLEDQGLMIDEKALIAATHNLCAHEEWTKVKQTAPPFEALVNSVMKELQKIHDKVKLDNE